jgi:hypothetical protein
MHPFQDAVTKISGTTRPPSNEHIEEENEIAEHIFGISQA